MQVLWSTLADRKHYTTASPLTSRKLNVRTDKTTSFAEREVCHQCNVFSAVTVVYDGHATHVPTNDSKYRISSNTVKRRDVLPALKEDLVNMFAISFHLVPMAVLNNIWFVFRELLYIKRGSLHHRRAKSAYRGLDVLCDLFNK